VTKRRDLPVSRASAGHSRGRKAEEAASDYLVTCGFVVLGQNVRLGALELDLVVRKADLVALVEVRTRRRGSQVGALASIGTVKRKRLLRAAERYLFEPPFPLEGVTRVRLDVCIVHTSSKTVTIEHFPGAITADTP
jgi:putative endonuclease